MPPLRFNGLILMILIGLMFIEDKWRLFRFIWFSFLWQSLTSPLIWYYDILWFVFVFSTVEYVFNNHIKGDK